MRNLDVIIDCRMFTASGIGVYLQNLLPRVAATMPDARIVVLGSPTTRSQLSASLPTAQVRELTSRIYTIREQFELFLQSRTQPAVWWSPHFNIPLAYRGPLVVTVHDLFHLSNREIARNPIKLAYARTMFATIAKRASKIICVSEFTAREFDRLVGSSPGQLTVIHNGLDASWFDRISGECPHDDAYFLFVGNVKPHKNLSGLIRAFGSIADAIPHDLIIVGKRSGFITTDRGAQQLPQNLESRVKFTGAVDLQTLRRWYFHAEALVFPSFYEGFGFPPLEAMAMQCPAIVSKVASVPEVCGDAALYCDPYDTNSIATAMLQIVRDQGLRANLVAKGISQAKKYRWGDAASRTCEVLQSFM